ncbi:MAG: hypothetical protein HY706_20750 [Candidatus Hydrogenedentes bacterium]|nr:hypothetical protein [Candidatus Hydrogenedentota bacterium]
MQRPTSVTVCAVLDMFLGLLILVLVAAELLVTASGLSSGWLTAGIEIADDFERSCRDIIYCLIPFQLAAGVLFVNAGLGLFFLRGWTCRRCNTLWFNVTGTIGSMSLFFFFGGMIAGIGISPNSVAFPGWTGVDVEIVLLSGGLILFYLPFLYLLAQASVLSRPYVRAAFRVAAKERGETWKEPERNRFTWY